MATGVSQLKMYKVRVTGVRHANQYPNAADPAPTGATAIPPTLVASINTLFAGQVVSADCKKPTEVRTNIQQYPFNLSYVSGYEDEDWEIVSRAWSPDLELLDNRLVIATFQSIHNAAHPGIRGTPTLFDYATLTSIWRIPTLPVDRTQEQNTVTIQCEPLHYILHGAGGVVTHERDVPANIYKLHGVDLFAALRTVVA